MSLKNLDFVEILSENTYPVLMIIACFRSEDQTDERGRFYFGSEAGF